MKGFMGRSHSSKYEVELINSIKNFNVNNYIHMVKIWFRVIIYRFCANVYIP